jgi:hypothetical protein
LPSIGKFGLESSVNESFGASVRSLAALAGPPGAKINAVKTAAPINIEHAVCLMMVSMIN